MVMLPLPSTIAVLKMRFMSAAGEVNVGGIGRRCGARPLSETLAPNRTRPVALMRPSDRDVAAIEHE